MCAEQSKEHYPTAKPSRKPRGVVRNRENWNTFLFGTKA
jgi:hypothetical protein